MAMQRSRAHLFSKQPLFVNRLGAIVTDVRIICLSLVSSGDSPGSIQLSRLGTLLLMKDVRETLEAKVGLVRSQTKSKGNVLRMPCVHIIAR